jgi:hypothetical protein
MLTLKLCIYFMMLTSNGDIKKDTTISGRAENAKAGAIVVASANSAVYYIDGLAAWDSKVLGQTVEVTGRLKITINKPPAPDEEEKGQIIGEIKTIIKPRWKVMN